MMARAGTMEIVTRFEAPRNVFLIDAWPKGGPAVSDIDFELTREIDDFYRKLIHVNGVIKGVNYIGPEVVISKVEVESITREFKMMEQIINDLTQQKIVDIKNKITAETTRLTESRTEILERTKSVTRFVPGWN